MMNLATRWLARYLNAPSTGYQPVTTSPPGVLKDMLQPGDVLLVEGDRRISVAIKYLTQSTWSHAAMYVGDVFNQGGETPAVLIEADLKEGVIAVPLVNYENLHTRICRPVGLNDDDRQQLVDYVKGRIGHQYDLKNIIDLARYLLPTPPVPVRWRRRMIALGSGDPTRAICSTLIAEAFQSIAYPILPEVEIARSARSGYQEREIMHIRHYSLFTPRDFDISPYFEIVKPGLGADFNHRAIHWAHDPGLMD